jgi:hypothetical protein
VKSGRHPENVDRWTLDKRRKSYSTASGRRANLDAIYL